MVKETTTLNGLEGAPFVVKTYQLVSDPSTNSLVGWSQTKDSFVVWNPVDFASEILPKYFKHSNFCSFIRQLNTYGFHKVESTKGWEFKHELFGEGKTTQLKNIIRRKSKKREAPLEQHLLSGPVPMTPQQSVPSTPSQNTHNINSNSPPTSNHIQSTTSPTSNGNISKSEQLMFGEIPVLPNIKQEPPGTPAISLAAPYSEEKEDEENLDSLKEINTILMNEVSRLKQQHESTQGTIQKILDELIESKKEQQHLQKKVKELEAKEKSSFILSPPYFVHGSSTGRNSANQTPNNQLPSKGMFNPDHYNYSEPTGDSFESFFVSGTQDDSNGLDWDFQELAHLELSGQDLAVILQQQQQQVTSSPSHPLGSDNSSPIYQPPPQSPHHHSSQGYPPSPSHSGQLSFQSPPASPAYVPNGSSYQTPPHSPYHGNPLSPLNLPTSPQFQFPPQSPVHH